MVQECILKYVIKLIKNIEPSEDRKDLDHLYSSDGSKRVEQDLLIAAQDEAELINPPPRRKFQTKHPDQGTGIRVESLAIQSASGEKEEKLKFKIF